MAEGVLPVCVGAATKLCETFTDHDKEYEAVMILGRSYDTLDVTGVLLEEKEVMSTKSEIKEAIRSFIGGYDQIPPMYSAKKVDGKKLYELARSGITVERKSVFVNIYDIEILGIDLPRVQIRVKCGKGTYIRSLIDDIGKKLGCGASMEKLTRTVVGEFRIENSYKLSDIEDAMAEEKISDVIVSLEDVFSDLPQARLDAGLSKLLRNGNVIRGKELRQLLPDMAKDVKEAARIRMYDRDGCFAGVYEYKISDDIFKPYKMFLN